jgi:hypothetical protein
VGTLRIENMEDVANPEYCQSLLSGRQFFDLAFGYGLKDFFFAATKLESVHGLKGIGFLLKRERLVFRGIFSNFHLLSPIP